MSWSRLAQSLSVVVERLVTWAFKTPEEQQLQQRVDDEKEQSETKKDWDSQYKRYLKWRRKN